MSYSKEEMLQMPPLERIRIHRSFLKNIEKEVEKDYLISITSDKELKEAEDLIQKILKLNSSPERNASIESLFSAINRFKNDSKSSVTSLPPEKRASQSEHEALLALPPQERIAQARKLGLVGRERFASRSKRSQ